MRKRHLTSLTAIGVIGLLALTGCTGKQQQTPTQAPTQVAVTPTQSTENGTVDLTRYYFTSDYSPAGFNLALTDAGKTRQYTDAVAGQGQAYSKNCGLTFLSRRLVSGSTSLTAADQQAQSAALVRQYQTKLGKAVAVGTGMLNTNDVVSQGTNQTYTVEVATAVYTAKQGNAVAQARVFADGTGVFIGILCRPGTAAPVLSDVAQLVIR